MEVTYHKLSRFLGKFGGVGIAEEEFTGQTMFVVCVNKVSTIFNFALDILHEALNAAPDGLSICILLFRVSDEVKSQQGRKHIRHLQDKGSRARTILTALRLFEAADYPVNSAQPTIDKFPWHGTTCEDLNGCVDSIAVLAVERFRLVQCISNGMDRIV